METPAFLFLRTQAPRLFFFKGASKVLHNTYDGSLLLSGFTVLSGRVN